MHSKTASPGRRAFQLKTAHEEHTEAQNQWFVFVRLDADSAARPTFHVAPRNLVAAVLWAIRKQAEEVDGKKVGAWLNFLTEWLGEACEDAWDALLTPSKEMAVRVPPYIADVALQWGRDQDRQALRREG